jgi:acyl-CoA reductase-like NAD-dependent aldehyde dehydrogenase
VGTGPTIEELIQAVSRLAPEERARLVRALAQNILEPEHEITELRGLGKEVWNNIDAQEYINAERDTWQS